MDINGYINVVAKDLCYLKKDISKIEDIANLIIAQSLLGAKVYIIGNGGSASTASHFAQGLCDAGIFAFSLADNTSVTTALANDLGYENIFSNQLKNILSPDDVVIGISGSGNSPNIVKAIELANKMGCITICLLGFDGGKLKDIAQKFIHVKDDNYGRIEDVHLSLAHIISLYIKDAKKND